MKPEKIWLRKLDYKPWHEAILHTRQPDNHLDWFTEYHIAPRWNDAIETIPSKNGRYIVLTFDKDIPGVHSCHVLQYRNGGWFSDYHKWTNISHWMPIPAPPEEE